jgi:hypothetical protein
MRLMTCPLSNEEVESMSQHRIGEVPEPSLCETACLSWQRPYPLLHTPKDEQTSQAHGQIWASTSPGSRTPLLRWWGARHSGTVSHWLHDNESERETVITASACWSSKPREGRAGGRARKIRRGN